MSREEIKKLFIAGAIFAGALAYLISNHILDTAQAIESTIVFALVLVTVTYAKRTAEMAKEMREQRLVMYKPHITLEMTSGTRGEYFMKAIGVRGANEGPGAAINVELRIAHPLFKFSKFRYPYAISAREHLSARDLVVEEPSVDDDPGVPVDPVALIVANYEDVSGNPWHSTLELRWDATTKDIKPYTMKVGVSGHIHKGDN